MKKTDTILKREKYKIRLKNEDMDFLFNWLLGVGGLFGMSHGELFYVVSQMQQESPSEWRRVFMNHAGFLADQARGNERDNRLGVAAQQYLGAAYAFKAVLAFSDPATSDFITSVQAMESTFALGAKYLGAPISVIDVPYHDTTLPGYYLKIDHHPRPTLVMIGGGDTGREDLFYFAGYPGWQRGYNVLMVDLPGQGTNPGRGLTFTVLTNEAISASIDWLELHDQNLSQIAIYGVSGGGYFTAQAVAQDKRIHAWVASTPIYDIAELFRNEFGAALKAPGWLMTGFLKLTRNVNESADISLKKYAWQFGTADFKSAIGEVLKQATIVDYEKITCPALFLNGENEATELKHQTQILYKNLQKRKIPVAFVEFSAQSGADAHCQVNNLRLAHLTIFDWLDKTLKHTSKRLGT